MSTVLDKKQVEQVLLLILVGTAVFIVAYWLNNAVASEVAVVEAVSRGSGTQRLPPQSSPPVKDQFSMFQTRERTMISSLNERDVFLSHSWLPPQPPPPPPPPPAPPVKPVAPPLPFSFLGTLDEKGMARRVFLTLGEQLIIVKSSDVMEGRYRIDQITDSSVELTYLPLNQKQIISIQ